MINLKRAVEKEIKKPIDAVTAETYLGRLVKSSATSPMKLKCSDGCVYAVKSLHFKRMLFNENVCAVLGRKIGAPIPRENFVEVTQELIDANQAPMKHYVAGIGHGSKLIENCSDKSGIDHIDEGRNRVKFAKLAILYGWFGGGDQQYIYEKSPPHNVYSVDHGHFFHGGPNWTMETLSKAPDSEPFAPLVNSCNFTKRELERACAPLVDLTDREIALAVSSAPDEWDVSLEERVAAAEYLINRRNQLKAIVAGKKDKDKKEAK